MTTVSFTLCLYSCYASPALPVPEFKRFLSHLEVGEPEAELIIASDFNTHTAFWGDSLTDRRGECLCEFTDSLGLNLFNGGKEPAFFGKG